MLINKCRKNKKILPNEVVSTDFQFDRFDDEGNAVRVPCDIKFGTTLTRKHLWIEACKEVMLGKFTVTENVTRNGLQLKCSTKSEGKFVSITFYTNGTILVQGKHTCITWRDTYFSKIRDLVNIKEREPNKIKADFRNDSPTIPNELPTNCENDNNMNLEEVSLSSTVIQQNTSAIPPASIVMPEQMSSCFSDKIVNLLENLNSNISTFTAQNAELIKIIHNKEIENTKLRNEREECRGGEQKLQAQVSRLSSDLKLANQTITGLEDDICVFSKQIAGKNENKNVVSHTPKPKRKLSKAHASFNSGILLSSTPASSAVTTSVEALFLRNGEIVPGLIHTDGVHLTNSGNTKLIDNNNKVISIRNVNSLVQPYQTYDRNTWDSYCYNCGSNYHTLSNCKHDQRIKCNFCFRLGHKEINCWYNHSA
ncbi:unnamed protein product [Mytilus coruscus]|uniref:CCHC-type domain-containing protein n=1 Tax=Mytilus coruscus TaxID=42192 RepID=A0A6J7ZWK8_MYTCO|nr:unnamed protein product [Mytilus coruscus]